MGPREQRHQILISWAAGFLSFCVLVSIEISRGLVWGRKASQRYCSVPRKEVQLKPQHKQFAASSTKWYRIITPFKPISLRYVSQRCKLYRPVHISRSYSPERLVPIRALGLWCCRLADGLLSPVNKGL